MSQIKPKNYEEAVSRLEEIADMLEKGNLALNDAVNLFEESVFLSDYCKKQLEDFKGKVTILKENGDTENE